MAKFIMCQSLKTNFYIPKEILAFTVRIFMKFIVTQFLGTSLVPYLKNNGQKMSHMTTKINLCHNVAANFTKLTNVQRH